ncbi:DNA polymerase gamma 1 [Sarotherodon galilaeus]
MLRLEDKASSGLEALAATGLPPPPMAVTLKLPDFWFHDPPSWFVHVEAQFPLRGVSADDIKYHHVVASLDPLSTRRMMTLLRDPPARAGPYHTVHAQGKYTALKALLLRRYSLSDAERAEKLLSLAGLGDSTALELMESMLSLLGADDRGFLFTHLFLQQLPAPVRAGLANSPLLATKDYRSLAEEVDRILLATRSFGVQAIVPDSPAVSPAPSLMLQGPSDSSTVAGIAARRHRGKGLCFYHQRFGAKARRCLPPCSFQTQGNGHASAL